MAIQNPVLPSHPSHQLIPSSVCRSPPINFRTLTSVNYPPTLAVQWPIELPNYANGTDSWTRSHADDAAIGPRLTRGPPCSPISSPGSEPTHDSALAQRTISPLKHYRFFFRPRANSCLRRRLPDLLRPDVQPSSGVKMEEKYGSSESVEGRAKPWPAGVEDLNRSFRSCCPGRGCPDRTGAREARREVIIG